MSTKITNNVFGLNLIKYAARIKIWLLLECNVQFSRKLNLVLKILKLIFWSWCWYEDACSPQDLVNARAQSSDFRKSPPLQHSTPPPCGQFCKCQISKLIAGKREREEHPTWGCHLRLMSWQNPVLSETLLLTHRLNRFRDLLFIFWQIAWTTIFQDRFRKLSKLGKYRVLPEG